MIIVSNKLKDWKHKLTFCLLSPPFVLTYLNQVSYHNKLQIKKLSFNFGTNYAVFKSGEVCVGKDLLARRKGHLLKIANSGKSASLIKRRQTCLA